MFPGEKRMERNSTSEVRRETQIKTVANAGTADDRAWALSPRQARGG